jgi:hypothetical protein
MDQIHFQWDVDKLWVQKIASWVGTVHWSVAHKTFRYRPKIRKLLGMCLPKYQSIPKMV